MSGPAVRRFRRLVVPLALAAFLAAARGAGARATLVPLSPYSSYTNPAAGAIGSPALSRDGTRIAFLHCYDPVGKNPRAISQLFVAGVYDTTLRQVTEADSLKDPRDPTFSDDGSWVYFTAVTASGARELFRAGATDGPPVRLTFQNAGTGVHPVGRPAALGPAGACFATGADLLRENLDLPTGERNIYRVDAAGQIDRLTEPGVHLLRNAAVLAGSTDGLLLTYSAEDPSLSHAHPYRPLLLHTDTRAVVPLTPDVGASTVQAGTTPIFDRLVFTSSADYVSHNSNSTPQVYRVLLTGNNLQRLTQVQFSGAEATGSDSSGGRVVFESRSSVLINETTGIWRVYTLNGTGIARLSTGSASSVAADGSRIAYVDTSDSLGTNGDKSLEIFSVRPDRTDRRQHSRFVTGVSETPDISTDGTFVVFASTANLTGENEDGGSEIFTSKSDGTELQQVTSSASDRTSRDPSISADGQFIVFASNAPLVPGQNPDGNHEIFRANRDGTGLVQITHTTVGSSRYPAVSADGTVVSFVSTANVVAGGVMGSGRVVVWREGGSMKLVTPSSDRDIEILQMNDDGTRVAILTTGTVGGQNANHARRPFAADTQGTTLSSPAIPGLILASSLAMSPEGNWLAAAGEDGMLRVVPYDGSAPADTVFSAPGVLAAYPSLSADARFLTFAVLVTSGTFRPGDTYVLERGADSPPVPLVEPAASSTPKPARISGDGARVAFVVTGKDSLNPDGSTEVFAAQLGSTAARLSSFTASRDGAGNVALLWTADPDQDHLYFRVERAPGARGPFEIVSGRIVGPGPRFEYIDGTAPRVPLWYVLDALDRSGNLERFGPIEVGMARADPVPRLEVRREPGVASFLVTIDMPESAHVRLDVFDVSGRVVRVLLDRAVPAGRTSIRWEGSNERGTKVASGVYYLRLNDQPARALVLAR